MLPCGHGAKILPMLQTVIMGGQLVRIGRIVSEFDYSLLWNSDSYGILVDLSILHYIVCYVMSGSQIDRVVKHQGKGDDTC